MCIAGKSKQSEAKPGKFHWIRNKTDKSAALIPTEDQDIDNQELKPANWMASQARSQIFRSDVCIARKSQQSGAKPGKFHWILSKTKLCCTDPYRRPGHQQSGAEASKLNSIQNKGPSVLLRCLHAAENQQSGAERTKLNSILTKSAALIHTENHNIHDQEPNPANWMISKAWSQICCSDAYIAKKIQQSGADLGKHNWILSKKQNLLHWSLQKTRTSTIRSRTQQTEWHLKQGAMSADQMAT